MKRLVFILFMILTCLRPLGHERMTRFTKTVVMLLVQSTTKQREASGNVFLSSWSDSSHYYLNVQFCEDNSGSSGGNGRISVKYLTSERNPFFKATKCTSDPDEDDLKSIQICLNKDKTFCPMFSFYITPQEDISPLYELVKSRQTYQRQILIIYTPLISWKRHRCSSQDWIVCTLLFRKTFKQPLRFIGGCW